MSTIKPVNVAVRHQLRPGDVGSIVLLHGTLYARECGWDHTFEAYVAGPLSEFAKRTNPRERIWLIDGDDRLAGSIAIVEATPREAQLRWLLLVPQLRGAGLGKRLIAEAIAFAREQRYDSIFLWTVKELEPAASLYRAAGFHVTEEHEAAMWGGQVVEQRYELRIAD